MAPLEGGITKPRRGLSEHQQRLAARLEGSQFRMLNESLYTSTGAEAVELMRSDDGELFQAYHSGFSRQAARWPSSPLDGVIAALRDYPRDAIVADFGCGEARLSAEAQQFVHSFDLVATNERVTACNMGSVPLEDNSVDIAVFCLALMNTDYGSGLSEARRVLRIGGILLVAEVASRFEGVQPGAFVKAVERLGFREKPGHKFVTSNGDESTKAKGKRRGKMKKNKKQKQKQGKSEGVSGEDKTEKAFFVRFAFEAIAQRDGKMRNWRGVGLPKLKACIYKRR